jgi:hypothetical protein
MLRNLDTKTVNFPTQKLKLTTRECDQLKKLKAVKFFEKHRRNQTEERTNY